MYRLAFATLALTAAPAAFAQDAMTQLGAHVHGASNLAIAADPETGLLTIEMEGPAYNLYGFERDPQTDEETALIARIQASLTDSSPFALTAAAGCSWRDGEIVGGPGEAADAHDHDHGHDDEHDHEHDHGHDHDEHDHDAHGHDHHDHSDAHDHGDHHDHGHDGAHDHHHDHDHGHAHEAHDGHDHDHSHSDVLVRWNFQCEAVSAIDRVDAAGLFERLPPLESLEAQFFDGVRAAAADLTRERAAFAIE